MSDQKIYTMKEFAQLLQTSEHTLWHIIDVGDIRPHEIMDDYRDRSLSEVLDSLRFSDVDVEPFKTELRRRRHEDFKIEYADVYVPDVGPGARGLEIGPGWIGIVQDYCDQLRALEAYHFVDALRWCKEKFGALRIFSGSDARCLTPLQTYWLTRFSERARRKSLRTCQECGQPGRLRLGAHAATLCEKHKHLVGTPRAEDGIILDPDRQKMNADGSVQNWHENFIGRYTMTDAELGLDEGLSMDLARQMEIEFKPFLSPDLRLDGTDQELNDLRKKLLDVDRAIGRYHEVKFQLRKRGYEIAIDRELMLSTVDDIKHGAIIAEIEMIMAGEQV